MNGLTTGLAPGDVAGAAAVGAAGGAWLIGDAGGAGGAVAGAGDS